MNPHRSILSVPGHVEKMHAKASRSKADVVMLDLEDSVPPEAKEAARQQVLKSLQSLDWQGRTVTVRINGLDTAFAYRDLLEIAEGAGDKLDAVVVPKVDHPGDIHFVDRMLDGIEQARQFERSIGIEASIETARGLSKATAIARASRRLQSLVFGIADYSASVGARLVSISGHGEGEADIYPGHRWHFAVSLMVMAAQANGLLAIDAPYGSFKDPEGLERASAMACALGCDGKWAIHPDQIDVINQVFSPSPEDIQRAVKVLQAVRDARAHGRGAVAVDNRMVDQATLRLARRLCA
ncbi:MAG: CoA ester lyase, partial [Desulfosarcinaceae bacterium]